jgi:hypothetical protein
MNNIITENTDLKKLRDNLYGILLFYFNKRMIQLDIYKQIRRKIKNIEESNTIIYLDEKCFLHLDDTAFDILTIMSKKTRLEYSLVWLFELKANQSPDSFNYILKKYVAEVKTFSQISTYLSINYDDLCPVKSEKLKSSLNFQTDTLIEHLTELNNNFIQPEPTDYNIINITQPKVQTLDIAKKPNLQDLILKGDSKKIEKIIVENFKQSSNIDINRMFVALEKLGYININFGNRNQIIEYLNNSIGFMRYEPKSIFKIKIDPFTDKNYIAIRNNLIKWIESESN